MRSIDTVGQNRAVENAPEMPEPDAPPTQSKRPGMEPSSSQPYDGEGAGPANATVAEPPMPSWTQSLGPVFQFLAALFGVKSEAPKASDAGGEQVFTGLQGLAKKEQPNPDSDVEVPAEKPEAAEATPEDTVETAPEDIEISEESADTEQVA